MEKMITDELTKTVILLSMTVAGTLTLLVKLIIKVHGSFKPFQKATIIYLLAGFLLFSVIACLGYWSYLKDQQFFYLLYQAYFLLLGMAHVHWMQEYLKWSGNGKALWSELLFTIIAGMLGSIGFLIVYRFFSPDGLEYNMATSIICFLIPWFVNQTFLSVMAIPASILKQWYYPVSEEIEEPDEDKLKNLLVISFVFQKQISDPHYTNFRAKAPVDMEMGELFYYFINDYNERHPHDKIEFINDSGEPYGWVFYKKPPFYTFQTRYIDADKTIYNSGIKENTEIICSRSLN